MLAGIGVSRLGSKERGRRAKAWIDKLKWGSLALLVGLSGAALLLNADDVMDIVLGIAMIVVAILIGLALALSYLP